VCRCYPLDLIYSLPHVYNVIETIETGDEIKWFVSEWDVFRHRSDAPHVMRRRAELAVFIRQWIKSYANGRLVSPFRAAHRATPNVENLLVIVLSTIKSKEKCIKILVLRSLVNEFGIPLLRRHGVNLLM
jgi:hypothetical protein